LAQTSDHTTVENSSDGHVSDANIEAKADTNEEKMELESAPQQTNLNVELELEEIELKIEDLLRGAINLLDIVKGVKYANLFKSVDLLTDVFIYSHRVENIGLALDVISISRTVIRKKSVLINYIGEKMSVLIW
jgi:hypothetical protein